MPVAEATPGPLPALRLPVTEMSSAVAYTGGAPLRHALRG